MMSAHPALCPVARTTSSGLAGTSGRSSLANFELRGHFHRPYSTCVSTSKLSRRGRYDGKGNPSQGNWPIVAQATSFVPSDLNRKYSTASGMAKTIPSSQEVSDKLDFFYTESGQREWVRSHFNATLFNLVCFSSVVLKMCTSSKFFSEKH